MHRLILDTTFAAVRGAAAGRVRLCGCPRALQLWACSVRVCTLALVAEENRRRVLQRAAACAGRALRFVTKNSVLSAALVSLSDSVVR